MPYDVKAVLSGIVLIVAAILSYWSRSPIRPDFSTLVMVMAVLMVAAMWVFPEAGVKKGDVAAQSSHVRLGQTRPSIHVVALMVACERDARRTEPSITTRTATRVFHAALLRASSAL